MSETAAFEVPEFDLADRMRKALRESGVSVQEMADYLEVSRNTIGRWINGHTEPTGPVTRLWALRTGVPFDWLRNGAIENPHPGGPGEGQMWAPRGSNPQPTDYGFAQVTELRRAA